MGCPTGAAMTCCLGGGQRPISWTPNTLTVGHARVPQRTQRAQRHSLGECLNERVGPKVSSWFSVINSWMEGRSYRTTPVSSPCPLSSRESQWVEVRCWSHSPALSSGALLPAAGLACFTQLCAGRRSSRLPLWGLCRPRVGCVHRPHAGCVGSKTFGLAVSGFHFQIRQGYL